MHLTRSAEYAFRALSCLTGLGVGEALRSEQIAAVAEVPAHYLSKVLRRLVVAGLITSQKGHHGGFALARSASSIHFAEVLKAVGLDAGLDRCGFGWSRCDPDSPCPLHPVWSELHESFDTWANTHTLSDIRPRQLTPEGLPERPAGVRRLPVVPLPRGRKPATRP